MYEQTNIPGLLKDSSKGVIINDNLGQLEQLKSQRRRVKVFQNMQDEIKRLRTDVEAIKLTIANK